jgi:DNA-binding CsgD family transcriptional regulator
MMDGFYLNFSWLILFLMKERIPEKAENYSNTLTNKEIECAYWLKKGLTAKEIAREMEISYRTVDKYVHLLKNKLHCRNKSHLISKLIHFY